jgi:hypothetical protein
MAVTAGVISFALGILLGAFGVFYWKFDPRMEAALNAQTQPADADGEEGGAPKKAGPPAGGMKGGGPPGGMRGGGPPGGGGGMRGGGGGMRGGGGTRGGGPPGGLGSQMMGAMANPKLMLGSLVTALDSLTAKPVEIKLTDDQRTALAKALKDLDPEEAMTDEEAGKKLEALMKIVEGHKEALEAVGYRWPNTPPPMPLSEVNPFSEGANKEHLKHLTERVEKK